MFDARSILDVLVRGGGQPQGAGPGAGAEIFRDLLGQLTGQSAPQPRNPQPSPSGRVAPGQEDDIEEPVPRGGRPFGYDRPGGPMPRGQEQDAPPPGQTGGGLEDLLRSILGGGQGGPGGGGNLQDMLRDLLGGGQGGPLNRMVGQGGQGQSGPGGVLDVMRQVLGQATTGVREGAGRLDEMTGASNRARDAIGQATGQSPDELIAKLKDLVANNQLGAGAALGGLGALILGTGTGRALAGSAVKLGGLALIGGLAYKAYQNYQQGLPPLAGGQPQAQQQPVAAAPHGSGFEPGAMTHDQATLYIRAMIAAAAADGRIDAREQEKILGGLQQAGLHEAAQQFLANEINNPASVEDLAAAVTSQADAVQVYTAARIAVDASSGAEHEFLRRLAKALGIDDDLVAQVDAAAGNPS
jgi:uncharacterized membrane protein YebE (DUF533 family)